MGLMDWLIVIAIAAWTLYSVRRMIKKKGGCSCSGSSCLGSCYACKNKCEHKE
ncbi:MAG TPA: FeoB-associated Cys-rich membrane protein [Firmicutes bacterium]|nr:FeoB-associated Cys-rich membrane protein [Bacillota bacterium]